MLEIERDANVQAQKYWGAMLQSRLTSTRATLV
jgi:hypothetical protein